MSDYSWENFAEGLGNADVSCGDTIFVHANVGFFGRKPHYLSAADVVTILLKDAAVCVPQFPHTNCGLFAKQVAESVIAETWGNSMFPVACVGQFAKSLASAPVEDAFGPESFWASFLERNGKIVNFNFDAGSTFIHYCEKQLNVPYREDREMNGTVYFSRDLDDPSAAPNFERFHQLACEQGLVKEAKVGRGSIVSITARDTFDLIERTLPREPYFLIERGRT